MPRNLAFERWWLLPSINITVIFSFKGLLHHLTNVGLFPHVLDLLYELFEKGKLIPINISKRLFRRDWQTRVACPPKLAASGSLPVAGTRPLAGV